MMTFFDCDVSILARMFNFEEHEIEVVRALPFDPDRPHIVRFVIKGADLPDGQVMPTFTRHDDGGTSLRTIAGPHGFEKQYDT